VSLIALLIVVLGGALAFGALGWLTRGAPPRRLLWLGAVLAVALFGAWRARTPRAAAAVHSGAVRLDPATRGYVTSSACRSCHPSEYQSWHDSYHRSMTESARPESVRAPWNEPQLEAEGQPYRLFRRDEQFWVEMPDPDHLARQGQRGAPLLGAVPRVERQVLMTTGSHHYQGYWVPGARGNELWQLPFVYHLESQRFLPRRAVFLEPPDDPAFWARWNSNCIQCHSVAGQPQHARDTDRFASRAAELGIACEACHGPGAAHVERQRSPLTRYQTRRADAGDPSIVNPSRLDAQRSSEVCGQCHAYFVPTDAERWWESGFVDAYRPGQPLEASHYLIDYERDRARAEELVGADLDSVFYTDGSVRVGGREYNGLVASACFERGTGERKLGCLSCHQLHGGTRDAQLPPSGSSDAACAGCHGDLASTLREHSHHAEASSGSSCVNCHMPYTSYALLGSVRSHRITRPSVDFEAEGLPPNACNSCHQDRSLRWTAEWLERWYGGPTPSRPSAAGAGAAAEAPAQRWSATAVGVLSGDAGTRVVLADQMGWEPARQASGQGWQAWLLIEALDDPYAAVRFVAVRSLRRLPGFAGFDFDFIAERGVRLERQREARQLAERELARSRPGPHVPDLPLDASGRIDPAFLAEQLRSRDPRPIRIAE